MSKEKAENWKNFFFSNYKTNPIQGDQLNYTVLNNTDLSREN